MVNLGESFPSLSRFVAAPVGLAGAVSFVSTPATQPAGCLVVWLQATYTPKHSGSGQEGVAVSCAARPCRTASFAQASLTMRQQHIWQCTLVLFLYIDTANRPQPSVACHAKVSMNVQQGSTSAIAHSTPGHGHTNSITTAANSKHLPLRLQTRNNQNGKGVYMHSHLQS